MLLHHEKTVPRLNNQDRPQANQDRSQTNNVSMAHLLQNYDMSLTF